MPARLIISIMIAGGLYVKIALIIAMLATIILIAIRTIIGYSLVKTITAVVITDASIVINKISR